MYLSQNLILNKNFSFRHSNIIKSNNINCYSILFDFRISITSINTITYAYFLSDLTSRNSLNMSLAMTHFIYKTITFI